MKNKFFLFFLFPIALVADMQKEPSPAPNMPPKDATRSARTCHDLNGVYVTGDFLYWKARNDDLVYVVQVAPTVGQTLTKFIVRPIEIDFEYKPGFRLGIGGDLPWNGWDLNLNWTRFSFDISSSTTSGIADLSLNVGGFDSIFFGRRGKIQWDFNYNSLEFDFGRRAFLDSSWIIRPSFGLKAVWFDNKNKLDLYEVESFNPNGAGLPGVDEYAKSEIDISGVGPFVSFYGKWNWIYGLGIAGQVSGSILWYDIDENAKTLRNELQNLTVRQSFGQLKFSTHRVRPYVQLFLGIDWEWCFIPKWLSAQLALGYEAQYFWSMLVDPINNRDDVPTSFDGLTFKARLDF